jgi:hypothetical protein
MDKQHEFWNKQPIIDTTKKVDNEEIIRTYEYENCEKQPIKISENYEWETIDFNNDNILDELTVF